MQAFTFSIFSIGEYPCGMTFALFACLAIFARASFVDKRKRSVSNWRKLFDFIKEVRIG